MATLLRLTNMSFAAYRQPPLYSWEKGMNGFHVTIASSVQEPDQALRKKMEDKINEEFAEKLKELTLTAEEVKVKLGNTVKLLPL